MITVKVGDTVLLSTSADSYTVDDIRLTSVETGFTAQLILQSQVEQGYSFGITDRDLHIAINNGRAKVVNHP